MRVNDVTRELDGLRNEDIFYAKFKSGGSSSLAVNGAATPVVFTLEDLAIDRFLLTRVIFIIGSSDAISLTNFANLPALTNGILFNFDGVHSFKNNGEISLFATDIMTESAKIEGVSSSVLRGNWSLFDVFENGLISNKADLAITVRDDLTAIPYIEFAAYGIKLN